MRIKKNGNVILLTNYKVRAPKIILNKMITLGIQITCNCVKRNKPVQFDIN
jgi:hypothetical protein